MIPNSLADIEEMRGTIQVSLDAERSFAQRNRAGQFSTPPELAIEMAMMAKEHLKGSQVRFLDPAIGTGVFFYAACKAFEERVNVALGYETDSAIAEKANELWQPLGLDVRHQDFCQAEAPHLDSQKPNFIICNPPYVRHHHLDAHRKRRLQKELMLAGYSLSGLAGLYCYFMLLAHRWLASDGVSTWVVPAECLDVNYGRSIKEYLMKDVTLVRLHRFDPTESQFSDALVSSVIILFRRGKPPKNSMVQLTTGGRLLQPQLVRIVPSASLSPRLKWGPLFAGSPVFAVDNTGALTIGDLFKVKRGLATGANDFFIIERSIADELNLPVRYLRPILPSPRAILGSVIEEDEAGFPKGLPRLVLLDCDLSIDEIQRQEPALAMYLESGMKRGISSRYLPSHRKCWYSQEVRPPAPIICTYMGRQNGGRALRFIRNKTCATAPNVYLLLYPKPRLASIIKKDPTSLEYVFDALSEAASRLAHSGRTYGGGLNKIEPRELEAVQLPQWIEERYPDLGEYHLATD